MSDPKRLDVLSDELADTGWWWSVETDADVATPPISVSPPKVRVRAESAGETIEVCGWDLEAALVRALAAIRAIDEVSTDG